MSKKSPPSTNQTNQKESAKQREISRALMSSPSGIRDGSLFEPLDGEYDTQYASTPGFFSLPSPSVHSTIASDRNPESECSPLQLNLLRRDKLPLLQLADWDEEKAYDEQPPSCIHYSIEWKVSLNNRVVTKDTEQDLVLAPGFHWQLFLKPKLDNLLHKKFSYDRRIRSDDTDIVVSINDRTQRDLIRRFENTDIDWPAIEKQLILWGDLFRAGKKLRLSISFNHIEDSHATRATSRRGDKRGPTSVTHRMLAEREAQINAEEDTDRQPSVWRKVYSMMRCPGPPCRLGPHCWQDPEGKKHYKLKTHHLRNLVKYVEKGGILDAHADMSDMIREQLYAEEQQYLGRKQRDTSFLTNGIPININVLPTQPSLASVTTAPSTTPPLSDGHHTNNLNIPGPRDDAVKEYTEWQESNVTDGKLKADFRKACNVALENGLDLVQVYKDQDPDFFIKHGVKIGIARHFVDDISVWAKRYEVNTDD